jgi:hypothetical protein
MKILLVRLQRHGPMNCCGLMDDDHDLHGSIIHGPGQVLFDGDRETREARVIISVHPPKIEVAMCAESPHPGIDGFTAHAGDREQQCRKH